MPDFVCILVIWNYYKVRIENEKKKFINNRINQAKDQNEMCREIENLILKRDQIAIESVISNQTECKENLQMADK